MSHLPVIVTKVDDLNRINELVHDALFDPDDIQVSDRTVSIILFREEVPAQARSRRLRLKTTALVPLRELVLRFRNVDGHDIRGDPHIGLNEINQVRAVDGSELELETTTSLRVRLSVSDIHIDLEDRGLRQDQARRVTWWLFGVIETSRNVTDQRGAAR